MNDFAHAGVYIQEVPSGPGPIAGVSTSNFGLVGYSPRGPVNQPTISTSFPEYVRQFGGFSDKGLAAHEAYAFFANGGSIMYFVRVAASDADAAAWDLMADTVEALAVNLEPTGIYSRQLEKTPLTHVGFSLHLNAAIPDNEYVFISDANGNLTVDPVNSGAAAIAAGGSGTINLTTGEINFTINDPTLYIPTGMQATYTYRVFRFQMAWPGEAGNFFRVRINPGSDDYLVQAEARWTRFDVMLDENVSGDALNPAWETVETWADLVFDDPTSPSYITTVINADGSGSSNLEVIDYGNYGNPQDLQGTQVIAEDFSATRVPQGSTATPPVAYDGTIKAWQYALADAPFQKTVSLGFQFSDYVEYDSGVATGGAAGTLNDTTKAWPLTSLMGYVLINKTLGWSAVITNNTATSITFVDINGGPSTPVAGDEYMLVSPKVKIGMGHNTATESVISPGTSSNPARIVPGTVCMQVNVDGVGTKYITDDGAGNLTLDPETLNAVVGKINYTTGQIASPTDVNNVLDFTGNELAVGIPILLGCLYYHSVAVEDDANGNLALSATQTAGVPTKYQLDTNGVNTVSYTTGVVKTTWKLTSDPSLGVPGVYSSVANYYTNPVSELSNILTGGTDGTDITSADVVDPDLAVDQEGVFAFGKVDAMMTLVAADFQTDTYVSWALIDYAELVKDKFVVLTVPHGLSYQEAVTWKKFQLNKYTSRAALYYPHIKVRDPITDVNLDIPCGGHVAGIYSRTDSTRNVGEAPAGMAKGSIQWAVGLEADLTETQCGIVYENKINPLVQWPHTGRVVWGARTLDMSGGEWPYIQQRRLFMFVEKSVFNATHVHIFENNGPTLWSKIDTQVSTFLKGLFDSGYLAGDTPAEAYFVICNSTNNPDTTVKKGIVFCDVGIAANVPGEFLVFRFQQKVIAAAA
ncbi:MAG: phage tail sheath subtilisin-like domain-containing protein [Dehalococcoidales bacterium]|nr:phage tail sheath subtilisin-like domain-containing protein [Dehalococcoidales bacterium]